jgi:tetratricopeptide (TPR) repeat protein
MSFGVSRAVIMAVCVAGVAGCGSLAKTTNLFGTPGSPEAAASSPEATAPSEATGTVLEPAPFQRPVAEPPPPGPDSAWVDPNDELELAKRHFRESNYGLAEMYFRRVVEKEMVPAKRKAEAWVGLAASYDRLHRFELADRAYGQAITILGRSPEILNNQGFSYMLRGDYRRAHATLTEALQKDPTNPYIQNNLILLEKSMRGGGGRKKV